jgi:hypothetical protein
VFFCHAQYKENSKYLKNMSPTYSVHVSNGVYECPSLNSTLSSYEILNGLSIKRGEVNEQRTIIIGLICSVMSSISITKKNLNMID